MRLAGPEIGENIACGSADGGYCNLFVHQNALGDAGPQWLHEGYHIQLQDLRQWFFLVIFACYFSAACETSYMAVMFC